MERKQILNKKSKKHDKMIVVITIVLVVTILSAGIAYAYFTANAGKKNHITFGYNKVELIEVYNPPETIEKGIEYTKKPYVKNVGSVDCYVRIKAVVSDSRIEKDLKIDYNTTDYTYNSEDGYYYYTKETAKGKGVISPDEETSPLFTTVGIDSKASDAVLDGYDIYVYAESVQTVEGKTMQEVWKCKGGDES